MTETPVIVACARCGLDVDLTGVTDQASADAAEVIHAPVIETDGSMTECVAP